MERLRGGGSRSESSLTLSPFAERTQQVGFDPSSGYLDFRGERRARRDAPKRSKKPAAVPLNERIALFATVEKTTVFVLG